MLSLEEDQDGCAVSGIGDTEIVQLHPFPGLNFIFARNEFSQTLFPFMLVHSYSYIALLPSSLELFGVPSEAFTPL